MLTLKARVRQWAKFWAKCSVATWLVHVATGLGWLQSLASVTLVLWGAIEAFRVLERLLEAFSCAPDGDEGDDGGGPEEHLPIIIRTEEEIHREAIRRTWPKSP